MTSSFRSLSVIEPVPYPSCDDMPSQQHILTIDLLDQILRSLPLDIYTMNQLTLDIKQSIMHLQCGLVYFFRFAVRLMGLINCIFQQFGINCFIFSKLVGRLRYCNGKWKKYLIKNLESLNLNIKIQTLFQYRVHRNIYLLCMLRTNNTILQKMLSRLVQRSYLTANCKKYLQNKGIFKHFSSIYQKVLLILQQKQEETYLKIYLINEFIKFILIEVHLCQSFQQKVEVFKKMFIIILYLCRIIKKFYSQSMIKIVESCLVLIKQGLQLYIRILQSKQSNYSIKIQHVKLIIRLIDPSYKFQPEKLVNQNLFTIKLIIMIISNWKKIHQQSTKKKSYSNEMSRQILPANRRVKKQYRMSNINRLTWNKISPPKVQDIKINNSLSFIKKRKSQRLLLEKKHQPRNSLFSNQPISNIKIRIQIERNASDYFKHLNQQHYSKIFSQNKNRVFSLKKQSQTSEQRELKLQEYSHYYSRVKAPPKNNKIQLYQQDKMVNYYRGKPKTKLLL